jgi:hypothetical protein
MSLLGHPTYLEGKPKGETSMSGKRGSAKVGSVVVPASPARKVKPALVEPQFPVAQKSARRSLLEAATPYDARLRIACGMTPVSSFAGGSPLRWTPGNERGKETNGECAV